MDNEESLLFWQTIKNTIANITLNKERNGVKMVNK